MKYLLDTNICIFLINQKSPNVLRRLELLKPGDVAISSITVAELTYGAEKSQAIKRNYEALEQFLIPLDIVDFDDRSAAAYGIIRTQLEKQGQPIGLLDNLIAAQAVAYQLILVTNNLAEFKRVKGLAVQDWSI